MILEKQLTKLNLSNFCKKESSMGKADERWDIYDINKKRTGRTMKRNDW